MGRADMSEKVDVSLKQLLADAKLLASKLKESSEKTDSLISEGKELQNEIDMMANWKESEEVSSFSYTHSPDFLENEKIKSLEKENKELRCAIIEQQNSLELFMSKYRQNITKLLKETKIDFPEKFMKNDDDSYNKVTNQAVRIYEMAKLMEKATQADDENILKGEENLQVLLTENKGLKKLLNIQETVKSGAKLEPEKSENTFKTMVRKRKYRKVNQHENVN